MTDISVKRSEFAFADIYIAGNREFARQYCAEFCLSGLCVNIIDADFAYTGGFESGVKIGLINYARFPCSQDVLTNTAKELASFMIMKLHQSSATVISPCGSFFVSRRKE